MAFLVLVLAILLVRFYPHREPQLLHKGIARWCGWVSGSAGVARLGAGRLYLLILVPVMLVFFAVVVLHALEWQFAGHLLSLLVLVLCFGATDLRERVDTYLNDLRRNDVQAAWHDAGDLVDGRGESNASNWQQLHAETLGAVTTAYYRCYFPVIFWFVVLGVPGAFLYRLVVVLGRGAEENESRRLQRILNWLDWLPLRLFGLALAVVGNFKPVVAYISKCLFRPPEAVAQLLPPLVVAAIHGDHISRGLDTPPLEVIELEELPPLVDRALVIWIAAVGVLALG